MTGESRFLIAPVPFVPLWLFLRFSTPKEGELIHKVSALQDPRDWRWAIWKVLFFGGLMVLDGMRDRFSHPDAVMIVWGVLSGAVMFFELYRSGLRMSRRLQEAVDLAAKKRGEDPDGVSLPISDDQSASAWSSDWRSTT
jgi:hypothetical protein